MKYKIGAWTEQEREDLLALWRSGVSAANSADLLKRSRNAVIGKWYRMGCKERNRRIHSLYTPYAHRVEK